MKKDVKKNFLYNVAYKVFAIIVPVITTPYISRCLGAENIGRYSYAYSIACYFGMFILLGLNNYGNRAIAMVRNAGEKIADTFWNIYAVQFLMTILCGTLYLVYCYQWASDKKIAFIFFIYILSNGLDINWFFWGMEKFKITITRNIVAKCISIIGIFILVHNRSDLYIYTLIVCLSFIISQLLLWPYLRSINFVRPRWKKIKKHIKPNLILFIPVISISLFTIMDKIMLGYISTKKEVGYYEAAEMIKNLPVVLVTALGTVMLPYMSNRVAHNSKNDEIIVSKSMRFALSITSAMTFGIMAVADIFVPIFYGEGFERCVTLYYFLLPSCLFLAFANVIRTQYLIPHEYDRIYIFSVTLGAVVNIIMNLLLIPKYESIGASIATLFAEGVVCIYQAYKIERELPIRRYGKYFFFWVVMGLLMFGIVKKINISQESVFLILGLKVVIGIFIYWVEVILFKRYVSVV